ncbi:MAG: exodeoxyribonuclease VII small subunit [Chloroflexi bacterium]|nr:exodeoxyribonuclease VII small subunit [Chloroflexota bacterium]|tara:strand:- start:1998 stop:2213 length:216 start_codon:yes stop_codon:yes gene_type:complete
MTEKTDSYEKKFELLEILVRKLEESSNIEESVKIFDEAIKLAKECHTLLQKSSLRIKQIEDDWNNIINNDE